MTSVNLFGKDWTNIVFDGRNKLYGAYKLREQSSRNTLLALAIGIGSLTTVFALSYVYNLGNNAAIHLPNTSDLEPTVVLVDLGDDVIDQPKTTAEIENTLADNSETAGATTNVQELKEFRDITVNQDHLANSNLAAQTDFNDNITSGQTSSQADLVNGNLKSGGENTGQNIGANANGSSNIIGTNTNDNTSGNGIVKFVQEKAKPVGGFDKFYESFVRKFQSTNLNVGASEIVVRLRFVVEKDGSFTDIKVLDDKFGVGDEAIRVLKKMPSWQPAKHNNQTVRSMFTLPIKIKINN